MVIGMSGELRHTETENGHCTYSSFPRLEQGIPCACQCIIYYIRSSVSTTGSSNIDHLLAFASRNIFTFEINYTTTEREGLAMVYALQNFQHYLLGGHFKMFTDHSALKYLVKKPVLGGKNMNMDTTILGI
jgi:hypothetical protein